MIPQPQATPSFRPTLSPHLHFEGETCPLCEQEIPPQRLEEISGKIAFRQHEQSLAITARLEQQFEAERANAEAAAKASLELERRQSAAREAASRDEAKTIAETAAAQIAAAEAARQKSETALQARIEQEQGAREVAEKASAAHREQLEKERQEGVTALATAKAESVARETAIRIEARRLAEAAMADKLAASETARAELDSALRAKIEQAEATRVAAEQKSETLKDELTALRKASVAELTKVKEYAAAEAIRIRHEATVAAEAVLQAKITDAEATRIAAEHKGAELQNQLTALQQSKEAELSKAKEDAAAEAVRIRQEATAAVEKLMAEKLATNAQAASDAAAKAAEAEAKLATLNEQHEAVLNEQLNSQREILETAKTAEINAIKARAFEDNQKQVDKLTAELRALEKKTNEELGEGAEVNLYEALKAEFPDDRINRIPKGSPGADIRHVVMLHGQECGTILYDSKNRGKFLYEHVAQLKADQLSDKADHAVLSTHKFPKGKRHLHMHDGVVLANPARVVDVVDLIRQHIIRTHTLRISGEKREGKKAALYEFIASDRFTQYLAAVDALAEELLEMQVKDKKAHDAKWKKEGELFKKILKAQADFSNQISCIIGTAAEPEVSQDELFQENIK
jgi:hypothetical protein